MSRLVPPTPSCDGPRADHGEKREPRRDQEAKGAANERLTGDAAIEKSEREGRRQRGASLDPSGFDAGKKVNGRKRHILTDTLGLLLAVSVHPASVQDRDGAEALLREARRSFPFLERIIADAGYQGRKMEAAVTRTGWWELQIVRRCDRHRFVVLPKRWIVLPRTILPDSVSSGQPWWLASVWLVPAGTQIPLLG